MGWGSNETHQFEATVEFKSAKARLIEMTLGGRYWVPDSQTKDFYPSDFDGNFIFVVSDWWWNIRDKNNILEPQDGQSGEQGKDSTEKGAV